MRFGVCTCAHTPALTCVSFLKTSMLRTPFAQPHRHTGTHAFGFVFDHIPLCVLFLWWAQIQAVFNAYNPPASINESTSGGSSGSGSGSGGGGGGGGCSSCGIVAQTPTGAKQNPNSEDTNSPTCVAASLPIISGTLPHQPKRENQNQQDAMAVGANPTMTQPEITRPSKKTKLSR
jgi:hypothetical protein